MLNLRRVMTLILLIAAVAGCGRREHAGIAPDVRRELAAAGSVADGWIAEARTRDVSDDGVIALGYLERLRLGMGSPFRLVDLALRDPRLDESTRRTVAWALLHRLLEREAYEIDAAVLDRAGAGDVSIWPGLGRQHLALIEDAIMEARDPRAGELAVRLGYRLAALEGSVNAGAPRLATRAAALIRDREIARRDAIRLLRSAEAVSGDPLRAVARWRSERYLDVEAPAMVDLSPAAERDALRQAPLLAQAIRNLAFRVAAGRPSVPQQVDVQPSLLTNNVAERLFAIADSMNMPPQAPVAIAARTYREELLRDPGLDSAEIARREAFIRLADEERFVAGLARLERQGLMDAAPSLSALWTAVALRAYAQEPVWFPGMDAPGTRQLEERFGLSSLRFADDVPAEWRPFYRRMLELSLQDMQRVLPALDLRGMAVRFGVSPRGEATLAMHDPRDRALILPPASAAGTIAHEVAHDLDWQVALKRYRVRGDYGSDRAAQGNDRLAVRVRTLTEAAAIEGGRSERHHAHATRPAENFARAIDWFVAASLAAQGRSNGYLTSIQDELITGYGTVRSPDITGRAGDAIIEILDEVAPLYPETRAWFAREYGSSRHHSSLDLLRSIGDVEGDTALMTAAPSSLAPVFDQFDALAQARSNGFHAIDSWVCRAPGGSVDPALEQARRHLVTQGVAARARGIALREARAIAGEPGVRWAARKLHGGPWSLPELDETVTAMLDELVDAAVRVAGAEPEAQRASFDLMAPPTGCSAQRF